MTKTNFVEKNAQIATNGHSPFECFGLELKGKGLIALLSAAQRRLGKKVIFTLAHEMCVVEKTRLGA